MGLAIKFMWMHRSRLRKLVVDWFRRSQGETVSEFDIFDRFTSLWISFNAWETYESDKESDRKKIEWAKMNTDLNSKFSELLSDDPTFRQDVTALQEMCPIRRNRPYKNSNEVTIANINNFNEVLEAIYVIRCNFFHGEKSPDDRRDRTLTELAFRILSKVFAAKISQLSSSGW